MEEKVLDIDVYFKQIKKLYGVIIIVTLITTMIAIYLATRIIPQYTSSVKVFIGKDNEYMKIYSEDEINYYKNFMDTFYDVLGIDNFMSKKLSKYDLDLKSSRIKNSLNISSTGKSLIFKISYSGYNKKISENILNAVCDELEEQVNNLGTEDKLQIVTKINTHRYMESKVKIISIGIMFGIISSLIIIFIVYYMDNTVKGKEDLEKVIPIDVIGEIPTFEKKYLKKEKRNVNYRGDASINIS